MLKDYADWVKHNMKMEIVGTGLSACPKKTW